MKSPPLNKKCKKAFEIISDEKFSSRIKYLERSQEFGFALLLKFIQIEASLKIIRYWEKTKDGWPDQLVFLRASWAPLRDLKATNPSNYDSLIGAGGNSLRELRNHIAHEGSCFDEMQYRVHEGVSNWALAELRNRLPAQHELKEKVSRLRARKVKA